MVDAQAFFLMREVVCDELPLSWEQGLEGRQGEVRLWFEALMIRGEWLNLLHLFARVNLLKLSLKRACWSVRLLTTIWWPQVDCLLMLDCPSDLSQILKYVDPFDCPYL